MQQRNINPLTIKLSRPGREYCQLKDSLQIPAAIVNRGVI
jgi:hypothetical protein